MGNEDSIKLNLNLTTTTSTQNTTVEKDNKEKSYSDNIFSTDSKTINIKADTIIMGNSYTVNDNSQNYNFNDYSQINYNNHTMPFGDVRNFQTSSQPDYFEMRMAEMDRQFEIAKQEYLNLVAKDRAAAAVDSSISGDYSSEQGYEPQMSDWEISNQKWWDDFNAKKQEYLDSVAQYKTNAAIDAALSNGRKAAQDTKPINTVNFAEFFNNLTPETAERLKTIEKQIKEKTTAKNQLTQEQSAEKIKLCEEIAALQNEYQAIEKQLSPGASPSQSYNKEFNFYSNLDEKELQTIKEKNQGIKALQDGLARKQQEIVSKKTALKNRMDELTKQNQDPKRVIEEISQEEKDYIIKLEKEYEADKITISDKINLLRDYIKSAGKTQENTNYSVLQVERAEAEANVPKNNATKRSIAGTVAQSMFDENGQPVKNMKQALNDSVKELAADHTYSEETINKVISFITNQVNGRNKDDFMNYIKSKDFAEEVGKAFSSDSQNRSPEMSLLTKICDSLLGGEGQFKTAMEEAAKNAKGTNVRRVSNLCKAGENADKVEKEPKTHSVANETDVQDKFDVDKKLDELISQNTIDKKVNVQKVATAIENDDTISDDIKADMISKLLEKTKGNGDENGRLDVQKKLLDKLETPKEKLEFLEKNLDFVKEYCKQTPIEKQETIIVVAAVANKVVVPSTNEPELAGKIAIILNEYAAKIELGNSLYIDENWNDTMEYASNVEIAKKKKSDEDDIFIIKSLMSNYTAKEIGKTCNSKNNIQEKTKAIALDICKHIKK